MADSRPASLDRVRRKRGPTSLAWEDAGPQPPPAPLTRMVGRERELATVSALLLDPNVRLVTLTGPGGVGKTRIALLMATELTAHFTDGVAFIALAPVRDPRLVATAVAETLRVQERRDTSLIERVTTYLRSRQMLLIFDNFEHVLEAAPLVGSLLADCPECTALVTSRAGLRLYGEHGFRVSPLPVPDPSALLPLAEIARSAPVRLFVDRARAAESSFALTVDNAPAIAAICARLDGLPLAIELAAARVAVLPPAALLTRLERRLPLLAGGGRNQPERHRAMRDAIAWSYDLLTKDEQTLLCRLTVCAGGFTLAAAAAIAGLGSPASPAVVTALEAVVSLVASLVDQSLLQRVVQDERAGQEPRFAMLETIREFVGEQLETSGEGEESRRRHATYFLSMAEALADQLAGTEMAPALDQLATDLPNIRVALAWARDRGEAETTLRLASALYPFWNFRGQLSEGRNWLVDALAMEETRATTRVDGLLAATGLAELQGDLQPAMALGEEALELARASGYRFGVARALLLLGAAAEWEGAFDRAASYFEQVLARGDDFGAEHWIARVLACLASTTHLRGDGERAAALAQDGMALARAAGHAWTVGLTLGVLANVAAERGDLAQAVEHYHDALVIAETLGDQRAVAGTVAGFAGVVAASGKNEQAARLLSAARAIGDAAGYTFLTHHLYYERVLAKARARLDERTFTAAWAAGQELAPDRAVAEAVAAAQAVVASPPTRRTTSGADALTRREREVLQLLAAGKSDREIAAMLFIGLRTVNAHVAHLYAKLGVTSRAAAAMAAVHRNLLDQL